MWSLFRVSLSLLAVLLFGQSGLAAEPGSLQVSGAYVREMPPGQPVTAGFLTLTNSSADPVVIIGAKSSVAERVEMHHHVHRDGMMSMQQVESVEVPARGRFVFSPGDFHLMLIGLHRPLRQGEQIGLELMAENGDVVQVQVPVKRLFE